MHAHYLALAFGFAVPLCVSATHCAVQADDGFDRQVAPLLAARCLDCHSGAKPEGSLDLTRRETTIAGGDSGPAVVPGQPDSSLAWQRIRDDEMPPKHPLTAAEKRLFHDWIKSGAVWGDGPIDRFRYTTERRAGYDWWALQPLQSIAAPEVSSNWPRNELDQFVLQRLAQADLAPSEPADARTLLRRVYFDLIGLPPSPEEVAAFSADPSHEHYAAIVEKLLAAPEYGERWGRHWLDVVRYGESDGFERNNPRKSFWQYRDWVITAFNNDMPYDEFVRWQLCGDVLDDGPTGLAAVGFMVAGVHNTVVGQSELMQKLARQDEWEEVIGTIGQTFLGLTVQCGRCHDHKFDPISQADYYRLIANIQGATHGERETRERDAARQLAKLTDQHRHVSQELAAIDQQARDQIVAARRAGKAEPAKLPQPIARWEFDADFKDSVGTAHGKPIGSAKLDQGALVVDGKSFVETAPLQRDVGEKTLAAWLRFDSLDQRGGGIISLQTPDGNTFDAIVYGEQEAKRWMAGSNFFRRTQSFGGAEEAAGPSRPVHVAIVYSPDGTIHAYRNGQLYGKPYRSVGLQSFSAGQSNVLFGLRHAPAGGNRFWTGRILQASLYDRALGPDEIVAIVEGDATFVSEDDIAAWLTGEAAEQRRMLKRQVAELARQRDELSKSTAQKIYTVVSKEPGPTQVLVRGDVNAPGQAVVPAGVPSLVGLTSEFGLTADASDADRRRRLADWITSRDNALFARVIVNRLWHYHFGTGIVETPNDFGFNGGRPTHPELLDWLARRLQAEGYRLKPLHRLMVLSNTYRQASRSQPAALAKDAGNRLLWRMSPRRLEAEVVRDAMLVIAGQLNRQVGGPSVEDVSITPNNGTTYYEPLDVDGPQFFRRTVYRFNPRGGRSALLDALDCPDPAATAPRRQVTTTPLQALSLLNSAFVLRMSDYFAQRIVQDAGASTDARISRAWRLALGREPDATEAQLARDLINAHGLPMLCRALFNSNEFVIIE